MFFLMDSDQLCHLFRHGLAEFQESRDASVWQLTGAGGGRGGQGRGSHFGIDFGHFRKTQGTPLHFTIFMISDEFRSAM